MQEDFLKNMSELKVLRCKGCGKMVVTLKDSACPTKCCGEPMEELKANTTDGAAEKHVPVVTRADGKLIVNVGSVDHPMLDAHYIEWVALVGDRGFRLETLKPGEAPHVEVPDDGTVKEVYEYCNLHGLWKTEA